MKDLGVPIFQETTIYASIAFFEYAHFLRLRLRRFTGEKSVVALPRTYTCQCYIFVTKMRGLGLVVITKFAHLIAHIFLKLSGQDETARFSQGDFFKGCIVSIYSC